MPPLIATIPAGRYSREDDAVRRASLGFTFHVQGGDVAVDHIVAVQPTTWGRVKALYRK